MWILIIIAIGTGTGGSAGSVGGTAITTVTVTNEAECKKVGDALSSGSAGSASGHQSLIKYACTKK